MAGYILEQLVEMYLTTNQGVFTNPQYLIGTPAGWAAKADLLTVVFPDRAIWMIEVTKTPGRKLYSKIVEFEREYVPRIKEQMQVHRVVPDHDPWEEWSIGLWIFAPEAALLGIEARMERAGVQKRSTTSLESTLKQIAGLNFVGR